MPDYTKEDLIEVALQTGLDSPDDYVHWGPCPKCDEWLMTIREKTPGDPFLYCGRLAGPRICSFGAGVDQLRRLMAKGWQAGQALPR